MALYGIRTCDTCRKARRALEAAGQDVRFVDLRDTPPSRDVITTWLDALGPDLVNRRSTTWRSLDPQDRETEPSKLLAAHPTLFKRPILDRDGTLYLGWGKDVQAAMLPPTGG
ncbi:MAG: ArsC/Spx/MgsR family protein [Pseudomonadota bacterium]